MKSGFGQFLDFGTSDRLDIAYSDTANCFSTFGNGNRSCIINELCIISMNYAKKSQKSGFGPFSGVMCAGST